MRKYHVIIFFLIYSFLTAHSFAQTDTALISGFADIGKVKLYYEIKGMGTPVILIHAGSMDLRMWDDQFTAFAEHFRVIRYDARNHGKSRSEADTFSHHEDLNKLMETLNLSRAVIIGVSMGGYIAIDFTLAHPEKVIALIPVGSGLTGYDFKDSLSLDLNKKRREAKTYEELVECTQRVWTDGPFRTPDKVAPGFRDKAKNMYMDFFTGYIPGAKERRLTPAAINRLSEISVPTLTIHGELDMPGIFEISTLIKKDIKNSKEIIIGNAGHIVNMEQPAEFFKAVFGFLNELGLANLKY